MRLGSRPEEQRLQERVRSFLAAQLPRPRRAPARARRPDRVSAPVAGRALRGRLRRLRLAGRVRRRRPADRRSRSSSTRSSPPRERPSSSRSSGSTSSVPPCSHSAPTRRSGAMCLRSSRRRRSGARASRSRRRGPISPRSARRRSRPTAATSSAGRRRGSRGGSSPAGAACSPAPIPTSPPHKGISLLIVDLESPGVEVRPMVQITGHAEFCEIFLDDVFVPQENLLGEPRPGLEDRDARRRPRARHGRRAAPGDAAHLARPAGRRRRGRRPSTARPLLADESVRRRWRGRSSRSRCCATTRRGRCRAFLNGGAGRPRELRA